jgi:type IV pilus assembly protein PilA
MNSLHQRRKLEHLEPRTVNLEPDSGFTLIELLIVMSIIIVLMVLAIPQALKMTKNAHQTSAVQTMKLLASSELSYSSTYPTNGYGCPIAVLGGDPHSGAPSPQAAQLIDPTLAATGAKSGYIFTVTCGSKTTMNNQDVYNSVDITGVPQSVGRTGDNGYCTDANNIIKVDPTGGTNCTQPLQ